MSHAFIVQSKTLFMSGLLLTASGLAHAQQSQSFTFPIDYEGQNVGTLEGTSVAVSASCGSNSEYTTTTYHIGGWAINYPLYGGGPVSQTTATFTTLASGAGGSQSCPAAGWTLTPGTTIDFASGSQSCGNGNLGSINAWQGDYVILSLGAAPADTYATLPNTATVCSDN